MKIVLYADNTLAIPINSICKVLNAACQQLSFAAGKEPVHLRDSNITSPSTYVGLPKRLLAEIEKFDMAVLCTNVPYDNNYFFEPHEYAVIVSFAGWNELTDLPITNGLVYFIASIMCDIVGIGETHQENTGCINDFLWDKGGVNAGMRAAFICGSCAGSFEGDPKMLRDIQKMLDLVSTTSRAGKDIAGATAPPPSKPRKSQPKFDVFLCHNSQDKPAVRAVNQFFRSAGVATWLDEDQLSPGVAWQAELEKQIGNVRMACVFVGENSIGPWQNAEIRAFLSEFVSRRCTVIPVILPDAKKVPELPLFLKQLMWVDLRRDYEKNLGRLLAAVKPK